MRKKLEDRLSISQDDMNRQLESAIRPIWDAYNEYATFVAKALEIRMQAIEASYRTALSVLHGIGDVADIGPHDLQSDVKLP